MYSNLQVALVIIKVMVALIAIGLILLFALKMRQIRRNRLTAAYLGKHNDWFTYVLSNLDGEEPLHAPLGALTPIERRILQDRLIVWIEHLKGRPKEKLTRLCEEMGLIKLQLQRLKSPFEWIKIDAAYYLGGMRSPHAVPPMLKFLGSLKFGPLAFIVARSVAKCTRQTGQLREMVMLLTAHKKEVHPLIADILLESDLDIEPMLLDFLRGERQDLTHLALVALQNHTNPAISEVLFKIIESSEKELRIKAARLYTRSNASLTSVRVSRLLQHSDWEIRADTAQALGLLGMKESVVLLQEALSDPHWRVRYNSGKSLAQLGEEGFTALCEAACRQEAAFALEIQTVIDEQMNMRNQLETNIEGLALKNIQSIVYERFFGRKPQLVGEHR